MKLEVSFYKRNDVARIARELLGKALFTRQNGALTGGMIVETEAYSSIERGSHAYQNRRTKRNEVMFEAGGRAYVYLCYGIHNMFNVVTNSSGNADAVLIRALEPIEGIDLMVNRFYICSKDKPCGVLKPSCSSPKLQGHHYVNPA